MVMIGGLYKYFSLTKRFINHACRLLVLLATILCLPPSILAVELSASGAEVLLAKYADLKTHLAKNQYGMPLYLEYQEQDNSLRVDMYGIFDYPFDGVRDALQGPDNWCDISLLLINIKACTYRKVSDRSVMTLYSGRKYYQPPEDAFELFLNFRLAALQQKYLGLELAGEKGPLGTRDHRIRFEATPLAKDRTFIHFSYDYSFGVLARATMASYYATIGSNKKGFSISTTDKKGDPVYVSGARGSLERIAVRYYLAIQVYMGTLEMPLDQRFEKRISRWFDLTARFPRQLNEMGKGQYLANKRREHNNQSMLQIEAGK